MLNKTYYVSVSLRNDKYALYKYNSSGEVIKFVNKFLNNKYSINRSIFIYVTQNNDNSKANLICEVSYLYQKFCIYIHRIYDDEEISQICDNIIVLARNKNNN